MNAAPVKVFFETDMTYDVDDVGALAVLHALADAGEAELLAVSFNETHRSGAAAIAAINTWYGRGGTPIGIFGGELQAPDPSRYLDHVAAFPHDPGREATPDSLELYRNVLGSQPDGAVTIVSIGFLNNLDVLLREEPRLVAAKVRQLVVMGGRHNDGFNLVRHSLVDVTQRVITDWPTPLAITDFGAACARALHCSTRRSKTPCARPTSATSARASAAAQAGIRWQLFTASLALAIGLRMSQKGKQVSRMAMFGSSGRRIGHTSVHARTPKSFKRGSRN